MKQCIETVKILLKGLKRDFLILSDLSHLDSMDADCASEVGALMDVCTAGGLSTVLRVMPDPERTSDSISFPVFINLRR